VLQARQGEAPVRRRGRDEHDIAGALLTPAETVQTPTSETSFTWMRAAGWRYSGSGEMGEVIEE